MKKRQKKPDKARIPPMPEVKPLRSKDEEKPDGYLESLDDWYQNNLEAVSWFMENSDEIRKLVEKHNNGDR